MTTDLSNRTYVLGENAILGFLSYLTFHEKRVAVGNWSGVIYTCNLYDLVSATDYFYQFSYREVVSSELVSTDWFHFRTSESNTVVHKAKVRSIF